MDAKRVLVVDDEPHVVEACTAMLNMKGFDATGVTSGEEAVALHQEENFDLVLVDLQMPGMSGLEVLREVKAYKPSTRVIIFTAYGTKETVIEALRLGASEFLEKPLDLHDLVDTVGRVLAERDRSMVRGNLRTLSLPNIVQVNCTERVQALLHVRYRGQEGLLYFQDGDIVHAELGEKTGNEAVYEMLSWEDGDFELEMDAQPPEHTITAGWSNLMLEGLRRADEAAAGELFDEEFEEWGEELGDEEWERAPARALSAAAAEQIELTLNKLLRQVEGRCVLMTGRGGRLIHWHGDVDESQAISLGALVAGSFAATAEIADVLRHEGETRRFRQSLQESEDFNIWSVAVTDEFTVSIVFDNQVPLGLVRVYTLRAIRQIRDILAQEQARQQAAEETLDEELRHGIRDTLQDLFGGLDDDFQQDISTALDDLFGD